MRVIPKRSTLVPHSKSPSAINANHLLGAIARISVGKKLRVEDGSNRVIPHLSTRHLVAIHRTQPALSELVTLNDGFGEIKIMDGIEFFAKIQFTHILLHFALRQEVECILQFFLRNGGRTIVTITRSNAKL